MAEEKDKTEDIKPIDPKVKEKMDERAALWAQANKELIEASKAKKK